jgi:hypothetical protein
MTIKQSPSKKGPRKGQAAMVARSAANRELFIEEQDDADQPTAPSPQSASPGSDVAPPTSPNPDVVIVPAQKEDDSTGLIDPRVLRPGPTA